MLIENDSFVVLTYIISIDEVCELCKLNYIVLIFNHFREGKESDSILFIPIEFVVLYHNKPTCECVYSSIGPIRGQSEGIWTNQRRGCGAENSAATTW